MFINVEYFRPNRWIHLSKGKHKLVLDLGSSANVCSLCYDSATLFARARFKAKEKEIYVN